MPFRFAVLILVFITTKVCALPFDLKSEGEFNKIVGTNITHTVTYDQSFYDIATQYNVGVLALIEANPGIDPLLPDPGTQVLIPYEVILPDVPHKGIVINLAELRLFYFPPSGKTVHVFPIGIGKHELDTPSLSSFVSEKKRNPQWRPPKALRSRYLKERGVELPLVVEPGPDNPLGLYAMRIGFTEYLIHGTNLDVGVGMRVSSGCIRMFPQDIEWLFLETRLNTPVRIINEPVKMAVNSKTGERYMQVHKPLSDIAGVDKSVFPLDRVVKDFVGDERVMFDKLYPHLKQPTGLIIPVH